MTDLAALEAAVRDARAEASRLWSAHRDAETRVREAERALAAGQRVASNAATGASVRAALRKAGFAARRGTLTDAVKGYDVRAHYGARQETIVTHEWGYRDCPKHEPETAYQLWLADYRNCLEAAGFGVTLNAQGDTLIVSKRAPEHD